MPANPIRRALEPQCTSSKLMPTLTWPNKSSPKPIEASLTIDSVVYPQGHGYPEALPQHHLYFGDNLKVMSALLSRYEGQIELIYADPPFFTNKHYAVRIGHGEDSRRPEEWQLAEGYADRWPNLDAYLDYLYPRLALMHRLLSPRGTLYVHLDWHANAYVRLLLDEIFGADHLLNEIVWLYHGPSPIRRAFNRKHDTILAYTKSAKYIFNVDAVRLPYHPSTVHTFEASEKAGFGKVPDLERGKVPEDWWYFPVVARLHRERTGYPTQKPEALLERMVLASSNPDSLVADFFCGAGTLPVVAARLGRQVLACDSAWRAIHTTRKRLVGMLQQPFTVWRETSAVIPSLSMTIESVLSSGKLQIILPSTPLDYWEIDPQWDGQVFRSVAQAWRPRNRNTLPLQLALPSVWSQIRLRAVTASGLQVEQSL